MQGFGVKVARKYRVLRKRGFPMANESMPPHGQAALWFNEVLGSVPRSGIYVALALARLCGDDSKVTMSYRSLSDAVGVRDSKGRLRAFSDGGVDVLVRYGFLQVETIGEKRGARTTFYLLPGEGNPQCGRMQST